MCKNVDMSQHPLSSFNGIHYIVNSREYITEASKSSGNDDFKDE